MLTFQFVHPFCEGSFTKQDCHCEILWIINLWSTLQLPWSTSHTVRAATKLASLHTAPYYLTWTQSCKGRSFHDDKSSRMTCKAGSQLEKPSSHTLRYPTTVTAYHLHVQQLRYTPSLKDRDSSDQASNEYEDTESRDPGICAWAKTQQAQSSDT